MEEYFPIILTLVVLVAVLVGAEALLRRVKLALLPSEERALLELARTTIPPDGPGPEQRGAFKGCANCRAPSLTLPYRDRAGRTYCSDDCLVWGALGPTDFCGPCVASTSNETTGDMNRVNGIGRGFGGRSERCPSCRSVVRRVWFTLLFLPVVPLGKYRVIQASPTQFWARKLR